MFICANVISVFGFYNSLYNKKKKIQNMKNKNNVMGYYISPPLIFNTVLSVLFILSSLAHSGTWTDMLPAFYPPFPKLPLQG